MNRLILLTTIGLFVLSWSLNLAFAEKTAVTWGDIRLQTKEARVLIENAGETPWKGGTVAVKIFQSGRQIDHGSIVLSGAIPPKQPRRVSVLLKETLKQGEFYQVQAFFKQGRAPVVSNVWSEAPVFDMPPAGARERLSRQQKNPKKIGYIAEPHQLRNSIKTIDMKKAMAVF
jgi:hypothetical protein